MTVMVDSILGCVLCYCCTHEYLGHKGSHLPRAIQLIRDRIKWILI